MTIKTHIYAASGTFKMNDYDNTNEVDKEEPQYINARGGTETIVSEKHIHCGTPKCCGQCATAKDKSVSELLQDGFREEQEEDESEYMNEDYSKHLEKFFKGRAL